jgi:hypothetical protein
MTLTDLWWRASIVAVGTVGVGHQVGPTQVVNYEKESVTLYPCEAEFRSVAVIKGDARIDNQMFLWFSFFPECGFGIKPQQEIHSVEQVWFLRTQGALLRPIKDPSAQFLELFRAFHPADEDSGDLRRSFSRTLLTPPAVAQTDVRFIERFNDLFTLSCEVSVEAWCLRLLGDLHKRASPTVRKEICRYRAGIYNQCRFSDCPEGILFPGTDGAEAERLQASRRASELRDTSEEKVQAALNSGDPSGKESTLRRLQILSCNIDPLVRERAREAARRFFPKAETPACLSCP